MASPSVFIGQQKNTPFPKAERIQVFTDRSMYIAGETVYFSAFAITKIRGEELPDKVLYVEIISPATEQLTGNKFRLEEHASSGSLVIPKDAITGIYYLRAYTKYMRNLEPSAYAYSCLKIINPMREEFRTGDDTTTFIKAGEENPNAPVLFEIRHDKQIYSPRQTVDVRIKSIDPLTNDLEGICLSVVPMLASCNQQMRLGTNGQNVKSLDFYPETRGLSITGTLKELKSGKTVPYTRVNLSIVGEGRDFMAIQTDSLGRFFFALPDYTGSRDLFLCSENTGGNPTELLVDNDFCAKPSLLPSPVFKLTEAERKLAYRMALNEQVSEVYANSSVDTVSLTINNNAFYGAPTGVIYIDKYVELPTLEEYFNELPTQVKVRKKQGKKYFKVLGTEAEMLVYDPLVLVDWVAVDNPEKVLAVSPKNIDRIEVVNEPYIKGNIVYGGIVHIISKEGDFAGIDLPQTGIFIDFRFLDNSLDKIKALPEITNKPDARNTLFWEPNLKLNKNHKNGISFAVPDTPGHYEIVLKGVKSNGDIYTQSSVFEVK